MRFKKKSPSYLVGSLIFVLLVYGIVAAKGIAPETSRRGSTKLDLTTIRFDITMLTHPISHSSRQCHNTEPLEGITPDLHMLRNTNWDFKASANNEILTPSLSVSIEGITGTVIEGNFFTIDVLVKNNGDSDVNDVIVSITLPSNLTSISTSQSLETIFGCGAGVSCRAPVSFTVLAKSPGTYIITVTASTTNATTVSDSVTITAFPSLSTTSSDKKNDDIFGFTVIFALLGLLALVLLFRNRIKSF